MSVQEKLNAISTYRKMIDILRCEIGEVIDASNLDRKTKKILRWRIVKTASLEKVGKEFGVTRERIRQIEVKALEQLKAITS